MAHTYLVLFGTYADDGESRVDLIAAFSSYNAAADFLSENEYQQVGNSGMRFEKGWGTSAEIVEVPIDSPEIKYECEGCDPIFESFWSGCVVG